MKKTISILLALFLFAALACYAPHGEESTVVVNDLPGVYCEIVEGTLTSEGAEVRFWHTLGDAHIMAGLPHFLEKEYFGKWYSMDHLRRYPYAETIWDAVGLPIFAECETNNPHLFDWGMYYPPLEPGHYRIVFPYNEGLGEARQRHLLATEFTIR